MLRLAKTAAGWIGRSWPFAVAVRAMEPFGNSNTGLLRVLTFHRIADPCERSDLDPSLVSATPTQFAHQIEWLSRDYQPISLADLNASIVAESPLPARSVLITFDDAYLDFAEHAWPILKSHNVPAVLFVPTAYPGDRRRSFWWDRLHCAIQATAHPLETELGQFSVASDEAKRATARQLKRLLKDQPDQTMNRIVNDLCQQTGADRPAPAVLDWDQLRQLAREGVTLGAHTHTHPLLNRLPLDAAADEIIRSRDLITEQIGSTPTAFAFPSGYYDQRSVDQVRAAGFEFAFTTVRGVNLVGQCDHHLLRRTNVGISRSDAMLRAQLHSLARRFNRSLPAAYPSSLQTDRGDSPQAVVDESPLELVDSIR